MSSTSGWGITADILREEREERERSKEWQRVYMGRWCPGPVEYQGHLLRCRLGDGHDGDCAASLRDIRQHHRGDCIANGCGRAR